MSKWKVILRDDKDASNVVHTETEIDFDGTKEELESHAHIIRVIGKVEEEKNKKEIKDNKKD